MLVREDYKKEIEYVGRIVVPGEKNSGITKRIQEWICLHRFHTPGWEIEIDIDDHYGNATKSAIKEFQAIYGLPQTGSVDEKTWYHLTLPMQRAFTKKSFDSNTHIKERLVQYMEQFVKEHPTELKQNSGCWIRAFMKGQDGKWAAWCCGTVCTALDHASDSMDRSMTDWLDWTWSCDVLMKNAKNSNKAVYYSQSEIKANPSIVERGDIFLVMKGSNDATHTGVVTKIDGSAIHTIEANTNDEGSREGYEMCKRVRNLSKGNYSIIKLL